MIRSGGVETIKLIVQATCVMHNLLREKDIDAGRGGSAAYGYLTPEECGDVTGLRDVSDAGASHSPPRQAAQIRDRYTEYFSGFGSVAWQLGSIRR